MGLTAVRQQHMLDHGFFPWFIEEDLKHLIDSFMSLWQYYCKNFTPEQKITHWPGSNEKIGYHSHFDEKGKLTKESLLLSIDFIENLSKETQEELGPNIFEVEYFIEALYEKSINNATNVFNFCSDINIPKIIRESRDGAVLHFSHYLPIDDKEFFSNPHFKKGYGAFLLAESGDNMEVFMNGRWQLIGLNEGQILAIPGKKLDECTNHEIPALNHRIKSSQEGYFAIKLFPTD